MIKAFTWGTFNYLHEGHRIFLSDIKSICNDLHVILIPKKEVFENKRVFPLEDTSRKDILMKLKIADFIHVDSYNMGLKSVLKYNPDIFVIGYDQNTMWEKKLSLFIKVNNLATKIIRSTKFANGVHSAKFR